MDNINQTNAAPLAKQIQDLADEVKSTREKFEENSGKLIDEINGGIDELGRDLEATDTELKKEEANASEQFDDAALKYVAETEKAEQ